MCIFKYLLCFSRSHVFFVLLFINIFWYLGRFMFLFQWLSLYLLHLLKMPLDPYILFKPLLPGFPGLPPPHPPYHLTPFMVYTTMSFSVFLLPFLSIFQVDDFNSVKSTQHISTLLVYLFPYLRFGLRCVLTYF